MRLIERCIRGALTCCTRRYADTLRHRLDGYRVQQTALCQEYGVDHVEPLAYSEQLRTEQRALHASHPGSHILLTSGSTSIPKELWYPDHRLDRLQKEFVQQVLLLAEELPLRSPSIYFLTSLRPSRSLSSALLRAPQLSFIEKFALSQSIVFAPRAVTLSETTPELWVHIAYILLTRPAVIVAANPSTILTALHNVICEWESGRAIVRRILPEVWQSFSSTRRLVCDYHDALGRALSLTERSTLTTRDLLPQLEGVACWTAGYVGPYITRLRAAIDTPELRILPIASLSTEEILGLNVPGIRDGSCVPLAERVAYEFIHEEDEARRPIKPWELRSGERYAMVVSNRYGLNRYDTSDLFLCNGMLGDAPLITFVGRSGLQYSFSGEKLTAEQLLEAYQRSYSRVQLALVDTLCFPEPGELDELPHYVFLATSLLESDQEQQLAREIDAALCEINDEYSSKRASGRLGLPRLHSRQLAQVITALTRLAAHGEDINRTQVKLLPLYPKLTWSQMKHGC